MFPDAGKLSLDEGRFLIDNNVHWGANLDMIALAHGPVGCGGFAQTTRLNLPGFYQGIDSFTSLHACTGLTDTDLDDAGDAKLAKALDEMRTLFPLARGATILTEDPVAMIDANINGIAKDKNSYYDAPFPVTSTLNSGYAFLDTTFDTFGVQHKLTTGFTGYSDEFYHGTVNTFPIPYTFTTNFYNQSAFHDPGTTTSYNKSGGYVDGQYFAKNYVFGDEIKIGDKLIILAGGNYTSQGTSNINQYGVITSGYGKAALTPTVSVMKRRMNGPNYVDALHNRGNLLRDLRRFPEALASYDKVIALKPDFAVAFNNRGNLLRELKRPADALANYAQALAIVPNYVEALNDRGNALMDLKRFEEALASYDKALAVRPDYTATLNNRGTALRELNRPNEALASYDSAITLNPDFAEAFNNKGIVLTELGQFDAANKAIETAIKLTPKKTSYYYSLLVCKRFTGGDPYLMAMEGLAQHISALAEDEQIELHFGLGKAYADVADYERSFRHFLDGNTIKRQQIAYDEKTTLQMLERTKALFSRDLMCVHEGIGDPSRVPVFILGMPRSGSTLVEQILASHPRVFGAGEIDEFGKATMGFSASTKASEALEALSFLPGELLNQIGKTYVDRIRGISPAAERITNKTPDNFRFIGLIHLVLPNARIIHTRREPIDTCIACFSKLFGDNSWPYTYNLGELGRYYRAYEALMAHWRNVLPEGAMLEVQYEEVVTNLEGQTRRIIEFCGLDWDARCLDFHKTERLVRTASKAQVRQPLFKTSVGRWRVYEKYLGPLLEALADK